ncbi:MAG TPA: energy transducer TonB [Chthoniobacterales bacterium]|jgi:TonB family protein
MKTNPGRSAYRAIFGAIVVLLVAAPLTTANAGWIEKPRPQLPYGVFLDGQQGSVVLSMTLDRSGRVTSTQVLRSSGFPALDQLAQNAADHWRLSPDSVVATDLTKGRVEMVKFVNPPPVPGHLLPNTMPYWAQVGLSRGR